MVAKVTLGLDQVADDSRAKVDVLSEEEGRRRRLGPVQAQLDRDKAMARASRMKLRDQHQHQLLHRRADSQPNVLGQLHCLSETDGASPLSVATTLDDTAAGAVAVHQPAGRPPRYETRERRLGDVDVKRVDSGKTTDADTEQNYRSASTL